MREEVYIKGMVEYWKEGWFGLNNWKEKWGRKYISKEWWNIGRKDDLDWIIERENEEVYIKGAMEYWKEGWFGLNNWKEKWGRKYICKEWWNIGRKDYLDWIIERENEEVYIKGVMEYWKEGSIYQRSDGILEVRMIWIE